MKHLLQLIAGSGLFFSLALVLDAKPAEAVLCDVGETCYTFNNAVANDTINQNIGSVVLTGSFEVPSGTNISNATEAGVTATFNTPPGTVSSQGSFFFNKSYTTTVGSITTALVLFCEGSSCTDSRPYNSGDTKASTYQMLLDFGVNFSTAPFPSTITLTSPNKGNINQICGILDSGDIGSNTCTEGENNRFELTSFDAGSELVIPSPFSALMLAPLALSVSGARKRYLPLIKGNPPTEA